MLKGRFRVLRYGLRWHEAESNHQTFVVCAMLHNAIVDYRESAADAYDLDNAQRFGSSVGDFEPYGDDEKKLLRSERQVYRVIGRAGQAEEFELLSFAEEEAQLKQLRVGSAGGSSHSDGRRRSSSSAGGGGGSSSNGVGSSSSAGGRSRGSSSSDGGGGGVIAGDDGEHEASSSSSAGGGGSSSSSGGGGIIAGDDDADDEHEAIGTGGGGRAARPAPGTREDVIAHYELREKLSEHLWYLKSHKLLSWDSGSRPLSTVGYNIDKEIGDLMDEMLSA